MNRLGLTLSKIFGSLCCSELQKSDLYFLFSSSRAAIKGIARYTTVLQQRRPLTIDRGAGASCINFIVRGEEEKFIFFLPFKVFGFSIFIQGKKLRGFFFWLRVNLDHLTRRAKAQCLCQLAYRFCDCYNMQKKITLLFLLKLFFRQKRIIRSTLCWSLESKTRLLRNRVFGSWSFSRRSIVGGFKSSRETKS